MAGPVASALGAALTRIGVSQADAIRYETALRADHFVLTVHGSAADEALAGRVLPHAKALQGA